MKIAVLASGRGSNLQAIIDSVANGDCAAEIAVVLSDKSDAFALKRAEKAGIPNFYVNPKAYENKAAYENKLLEYIRQYDCEFIVLAGYMRLVGETLLAAFPNRIINIHPALLPAFPGLHGQKQALDYGVKVAGCTVHFVDGGMDTGKIIAQRVVAVLPDDDEDSLSARILEQEHFIFPYVINKIAKGEVYLENNKVIIKE